MSTKFHKRTIYSLIREYFEWLLPFGYIGRYLTIGLASLWARADVTNVAAIHITERDKLIRQILDESQTAKLEHNSEILRLEREIERLQSDLDLRDLNIENLRATLAYKEGELGVATKQIEMLLAWHTTWTERMRAEAAISISKAERAVFESQQVSRPPERQ